MSDEPFNSVPAGEFTWFSSPREGGRSANRVLRGCELLARDLTNTPSVTQLARMVGTNRNTLTREFQAALGRSPIAWLREQRLLEARRLLQETDWPIYRISDAVGYPDPNHFSTCFKRRFGLPPRALRRRADDA